MSLHTGKILEISITKNSRKEILEYVRKYLQKNPKSKIQNPKKDIKPFVIVTPNPEQIVLAQHDGHFAGILNQADVAIPDGVGIVAAMRLLNIKNQKLKIKDTIRRIPGVEFMDDLVRLAADRGYPVGLIGGRGGLAVRALECLRREYPTLTGWALEPGEVFLGNLGNLGYLSEKIRKTNTRFVFVGLGAPKQEYFIEELRKSLIGNRERKDGAIAVSDSRLANNVILMSVGGAFDIIAGRIPRAPLFIRLMGFEWAWRLIREPWRFRRQLALLQFIWLVLRARLSRRSR